MDNPFIVGALAWLIPGSGHLIQGKLKRGIIVEPFSGGYYCDDAQGSKGACGA